MTFWDNAEISELNRPAIRSDDLLHLADYYETDKGRKFGNKHGYTELYERKFLPRRHNKLRILEIGIAGGSSLKMWASWFTDAEVHGIDINGNCRGLCKEFSNIRIHIGDASTFDFGETRFDIVIDDGSHLADDIIKTYANLGRFCHEDTIYVIEDMHSTRDEVYIEAFRLGRGEGLSEVAWRDLQGFTRLRKFIAELSVSLQVEVYNEKIAFIRAEYGD